MYVLGIARGEEWEGEINTLFEEITPENNKPRDPSSINSKHDLWRINTIKKQW